MASLETCSNNIAKTMGAWGTLRAPRASLNLRLADAYRQIGRPAEAAGMEQRLLAPLAE